MTFMPRMTVCKLLLIIIIFMLSLLNMNIFCLCRQWRSSREKRLPHRDTRLHTVSFRRHTNTLIAVLCGSVLTVWCLILNTRVMFLKWSNQSAPPLVRKAKRLLNEIVSRGRGTPPLSSYHDSSNGQNGAVHEMMIPAGKAGLVIGKGGETIKQLQVSFMFFASAFLEVSMTQPELIRPNLNLFLKVSIFTLK